ncbi:MAG TPA: FCD domain-containing protein [Ilumatobacteraceae bacterium]|nr:FCD domain-containing protein [Ilumatobacteraceae bacterium]
MNTSQQQLSKSDRARQQRHLRPPRLAEMASDALRERILSGEFPDGSSLPKQEELLEEFGVSLPPIREALRILESEGLITVQRGNVGGAIVHCPQPSKVAYMLGLVLQSRGTTLGDVLTAITTFEPACAAECARREDRVTEVLPRLRAVIDESIELIADTEHYTGAARRFHNELVALCGNEAMTQVVGSLETLWTAHVDTLARGAAQFGSFAEPTARQKSVDEHEAIYAAIKKGDAATAERLSREHYTHQHAFAWGDELDAKLLIDVTHLRTT